MNVHLQNNTSFSCAQRADGGGGKNDHHGNTRAVYRIPECGSGGPKYEFEALIDYYPFGKELRSSVPLHEKYYTTHHERDLKTQLDYRGARFYDAETGRFWGVDGMASAAPEWTTYNAIWNNPVKYIDPNGLWAVDHIDVTQNDDGTYNIVDGQANSDMNIYVVDGSGNRTGEVFGQMLTEYSFHHEDGSAVVGATINSNDQSGQNFFNGEISSIGLFDYMSNAKGGQPLDFKTREMPSGLTPEARGQYTYRGMPFQGKVASARDIGNYAAGYVAGIHGFGWTASRFAFDALETKQTEGTTSTILLYPFNRIREGQPTQRAQRAGHDVGYAIFKQRANERELHKAKNPWPTGLK